MTNVKLLKYTKVYDFFNFWQSPGEKKESIEIWDNCQLDKNKQHILVRKRWADTDLEFFPGSYMLVCHVVSSHAPFEMQAQNWGSWTFVSLHLYCCSTGCLYLITSYCWLSKVIPSLLLVMLGAETSTSTQSVHGHKISDLQFS